MRPSTRAVNRISLSFAIITAIVTGTAFATDVLLYKNPQCGCCENYADYLRANDFEVTVKSTPELLALSSERGLSNAYQGCHLAMIDGYFVSGHVPVTVIERMLLERPDIDGITLPGMPQGSPGMGGTKKGPWKIFSIDDGVPAVFAVK